MADPTAYDELQDERLDSLESLITAEYEPPAGAQYSYPVASQGITQEQFRTMMRAAGKGTFVQHDEGGAQIAYRLIKHDTDSETNQRNTLILRPSSHTGKAETVSNGFFHVLTEDMELPFPAVTTATTYHVTITYDPRLFKTTPLKIEVYPGEPPTTNGRDHVVLWTVRREPNQLLSQATLTQKAAWISSVITCFAYHQLPEPWEVNYGTLGVVVNTTTGVSDLYTSRGVHGWVPLVETKPFTGRLLVNNWENYEQFGPFGAKVERGRVYLQGVIRNGQWSSSLSFAHLPDDMRPSVTRIIPGWATGAEKIVDVRVSPNGAMRFNNTRGDRPAWVSFDGVSFDI